MTGIATSVFSGLFIRVSRCKDTGLKPYHYFIYYTCESMSEESGRPSAGFIPPRPLSLPSRPYGKRSSSRSFRLRRTLRGCVSASSHASLSPVPWAPSPPRGLPLLLPRAGETVAARAVHSLARAHAPMARPRRPSVPDRRPARALLREKRSR